MSEQQRENQPAILRLSKAIIDAKNHPQHVAEPPKLGHGKPYEWRDLLQQSNFEEMSPHVREKIAAKQKKANARDTNQGLKPAA